MIAIAKPPVCTNERFIEMIPAISDQARLAFRSADPEAKEELVAETIANAFCAFQRLVQLGKQSVAFPTPLAWYAIKQVRSGRRVGSKLNTRDVTSRHAQRVKGVVVERLDQFDGGDCEWKDIVVEDRHAGPAETAAARIDVAAWFQSLARKKRRIAQTLAKGEATGTVARMFGLTAGRISQLRREFEESWSQFQGEMAAVA